MKLNEFPAAGWDETQTDEEAAGEHEAALSSPTGTVMEVPSELVPVFRELIARHEQERRARK